VLFLGGNVSTFELKKEGLESFKLTGLFVKISASLIAFLAVAAIGISSYLAYVSLTSSKVAGCGEVFDCSHVLQSKYSTVFGWPVSLGAVAVHLSILAAAIVFLAAKQKTTRQRSMWVMTTGSLMAATAGIWFIGLQFLVEKAFCQYCLAAHTCGLLIATVASITVLRSGWGGKNLLWAAAIGIGSTGVLAALQSNNPEPKSHEVIQHPVDSEGEKTSTEGELDDLIFEPPIFDAPGEFEDEVDVIDSGESAGETPADPGDSTFFTRPSWDTLLIASLSRFCRCHATLSWGAGTGSSGGKVFCRNCLENQSPAQSTSFHQSAEQDPQSNSGQSAESQQQEGSKRIVSIGSGSSRLRLTAEDWPNVGNPNARYVFVEMFDYTCEHCRETHAAIKSAQATLGDDLGIVVLPVPMNPDCNPAVTRRSPESITACDLARISISVWRVNPEKFEELHEWMFEGASAPSVQAARAKAIELIGEEALDKQIQSKTVVQYIAKHSELYRRIGGGQIPKLLFPSATVIGSYTSGQALVELIKKHAK